MINKILIISDIKWDIFESQTLEGNELDCEAAAWYLKQFDDSTLLSVRMCPAV